MAIRRLGLDVPLHVGPGGLSTNPRRPDQQAERAAALGSQLESAEVAYVERAARRPDRAYAGATQGLIQRP